VDEFSVSERGIESKIFFKKRTPGGPVLSKGQKESRVNSRAGSSLQPAEGSLRIPKGKGGLKTQTRALLMFRRGGYCRIGKNSSFLQTENSEGAYRKKSGEGLQPRGRHPLWKVG